MSNLWQQPYVNVFKHFNVAQWKKASKEGEVTPLMDKTVKSTVFKLTGHIPANNYIQLPRVSSHPLGLTGRYMYLLFRPIPAKYFVVHVDVATQDSLVVRLSFSNLFKEFKSTSTWLQFPFLCNASKGSVDYYASVGAREHSGAAPASTRWTVLCLDLSYILSFYLNRSYAYVRGMRLCANMMVKNVFTSDVLYDPTVSMAEAKKMGGGRQVSPLPREFGFPVMKGDLWHDTYDLIRFPPDGEKKPFDSVQFSVDDSNKKYLEEPLEDKARLMSGPTKSISKCVSERVSMIHKLTTPKKPVNTQAVVQRVPELEAEDSMESNVHVYAHTNLNNSNQYSQGQGTAMATAAKPKKKERVKASLHIASNPQRNYKMLEPDPILKLKRIIGFGGGSYRDALWNADRSSVVYPCHSVVVVMRVSNGHQRFFIGHTDKVSCLAMNGSSSLLASGQTGQMSVVRVWKFQSGECLTMCKIHAHSLFSLSFSLNGTILCGVGKDSHGKNLVVIWSADVILKKREVHIIAKAHTDVDICRMMVAPFDENRMVSCGRDNLRLWRVKDGTLRSAPVSLGEHHSMDFTDICFQADHHTTRHPDDTFIYACSRSGHMVEVDYRKMTVNRVRRLMPTLLREKSKDGVSSTSGSGLAITSMSMNETFCVTGSEDGYLRLWPLDFAHVYLEAEHEGSVSAVCLSSDGMKILAGTTAGNLGVLDVATRDYTTIMRSHTARVNSIALDPSHRHMATVSQDRTIRVWDAESLQQLYDFSAPEECPSTICYNPFKQFFVCGFESGAVRVFNVQSTCLLAEYKHHRGAVTGVVYSPSGEYLYSCCSLGSLTAYLACDDSYTVIRTLYNTVARGTHFAPDALTISQCGHKLAFVGPTDFTVLVLDAKYLSELMRVDVSTLHHCELREPGMDHAVKVAFTPQSVGHLLVTTANNRLVKLDTSGRMVAEVSNIHMSGCSSLAMSRDGRHLITCGDRVIKVWDYTMRLDINFQVFIGHNENVSKVLYTPDSRNLITTGEAVYIWDNLAVRPQTPPIKGRMLSAKDADEHFVPGGMLPPPLNHSQCELPRTTQPRPMQPSFPEARLEDLSSIHNGGEMDDMETVISDPDAPPYSMLANDGFFDQPTDRNIQQREKHSIKDTATDLVVQEFSNLSASKTRKVAFTKHSPHRPQPRTQASRMKERTPKKGDGGEGRSAPVKPCGLKHFSPRRKTCSLAQRRYTAPPNQAGLKLSSVIGYNGNGRDNVIWCPESGLFVYSSGSVLVLEDLSTSKQTHLQGHTEEISTIAIQNDQQVLASASGCFGDSSPCQVCIWNLSTHTCKKVLSHHKHQVMCMAYSRDDRFLVTVGDYHDSEVVVWLTSSYTVLNSTRTDEAIHSLRWDPYTVNEFATVGERASLFFWLLDETTSTPSLSVHQADVPSELVMSQQGDSPEPAFTSLEYTGDSMLFVTGSNGKVSVWDTRQNSCFMHWEADTSEIMCVVGGGGRLLMGSREGHLRLWAVGTVADLKAPGGACRGPASLGITMEDEMTLDAAVVTACFDDIVEMGIVGTSACTLWYINWGERTSIRLMSGHPKQVTGISMAAGGLMATSSTDGSVRVWVLRNKEQALQFQVKDQVCKCVAFAPAVPRATRAVLSSDGQDEEAEETVPSLAAGYGDGTVRVFDVNTVEMQCKLHPNSAAVTALAFSADGGMILSGGQDGLIAVSSPTSGMTVRVITDHKGAPITSIDVPILKPCDLDPGVSSPQLWLACSSDRRVSVWSADWGRDICDLADWLTFPTPAFAPDGAPVKGKSQYSVLPPSLAKFSREEPDVVVYTGYGMTKCLQFYSLTHRKVMRTASLTHWASCLDLSADGPLIAIGVNERVLKLMDYHEGSFQDFASHDDSVSHTCFTVDGSQLVTAAHGQLLVWDVTL